MALSPPPLENIWLPLFLKFLIAFTILSFLYYIKIQTIYNKKITIKVTDSSFFNKNTCYSKFDSELMNSSINWLAPSFSISCRASVSNSFSVFLVYSKLPYLSSRATQYFFTSTSLVRCRKISVYLLRNIHLNVYYRVYQQKKDTHYLVIIRMTVDSVNDWKTKFSFS